MTKKDTDNRYIIKPNWGEIVFVAVGICIVYYLLNSGMQPNLPWNRVSILHILLLVGLLGALCRNYTLDSQGFWVMFFNIVLKKYDWSQIAKVVLVRKRLNGPAGNTEGVLLIIPQNCAPFRIGEDKVDMYIARHPFSVYSVNVSPKKVEEYATAFKKYYGRITDLETHK